MQTDTPKRRSNNMQTEISVRVSMCTGSNSPISDNDAYIGDNRDANDTTSATDTTVATDTTDGTVELSLGSEQSLDDSANVTVIHCGQGDSPKKATSHQENAEEVQEHRAKLAEKENRYNSTH